MYLFDRDGKMLWNSGAPAGPAASCVMQEDGDLVSYSRIIPRRHDLPDTGELELAIIWNTNTYNHPDSRLVLQNDGNLVILDPGNRVIWRANIPIRAQGDDMQPGEVFYPDESIRSANGRFSLVYQGDGNLVLYGPNGWLWQSGTAGIPGAICIMQGDGNLVIYYSNNQWIWDSQTDHNPGSRLIVQDDGKTVMYNNQNVPVWQTTKNKGFADIHNHQFAHLGFGGGGALWGGAYGDVSTQLRWCDGAHGAGGTGDIIDRIMMEVNPGGVRPTIGHLEGGNPQFDGWPRWDSYTHQSVYEDWLYHAWRGGLRLMVMLAVNSEFVCSLVRKGLGRTCSDMEAVDLQIVGAKNMQAYIDEKWGGPGRGWYRIVKTPDEAQRVIDDNKLAVVLGIEVDYLFGSYLPDSLTEEQVRNQLDRYYDLGVRHIFPIHFSNNAFGGASFDKALQNDPNLGLVEKIAGITAPYKIITQSNYAYKYKGGRMNVQGLTDLGKFLIRELMARGMIIDVDHMSYKSRSDTLDIAEANNYPVVSSHTGFVEISNGDKRHEGQLLPIEIERIRGLGGMVAIIPNQGKFDQINTYDSGIGGKTVVKHTCGHSSETVVQAYLYALSKMQGGLVGIGTDCNAFTGGPASDSEGRPVQVVGGRVGIPTKLFIRLWQMQVEFC